MRENQFLVFPLLPQNNMIWFGGFEIIRTIKIPKLLIDNKIKQKNGKKTL